MTWEQPWWFAALLILPLLAALHWRSRRLREFAVSQIGGDLSKRLAAATNDSGPTLLLLAGLACLIVAAARPRFGEAMQETVARGADIIVALDVSRSMLAQDVAPNRLARAKTDIRDLLQQLEGDRVGLIAFAGEAVLSCPLSIDHGFLLAALEELDVDSAPRGGTSIGNALRKALDSLEARADRDQAIVLITDGDDLEESLEEPIQAAKRQNVRVIAVGLGDVREGARVPVPNNAGGNSFLTYQGEIVWSKLREDVLEQIALETGGAYVPARTRNYDLGQVYQQQLEGLQRGELRRERRKRLQDQFPWFVGAGVILLLLERTSRRR